MMTASNIQYEIAERVRAAAPGGMSYELHDRSIWLEWSYAETPQTVAQVQPALGHLTSGSRCK